MRYFKNLLRQCAKVVKARIVRRYGIGAVASLLMFSFQVAFADFETGYAAYQKGDYAVALRDWMPLAEGDHAEAQYFVGELYANGQGVEKNAADAVGWYWVAGTNGFPEAQIAMGEAYRKGLGVEQNDGLALEWTLKAARQGHPFGQFVAGLMIALDDSAAARTEALKWLYLADVTGYPQAKANFDLIASGASQDEISDAIRLANQCFKAAYEGC